VHSKRVLNTPGLQQGDQPVDVLPIGSKYERVRAYLLGERDPREESEGENEEEKCTPLEEGKG
jgi:hypothetical protein